MRVGSSDKMQHMGRIESTFDVDGRMRGELKARAASPNSNQRVKEHHPLLLYNFGCLVEHSLLSHIFS